MAHVYREDRSVRKRAAMLDNPDHLRFLAGLLVIFSVRVFPLESSRWS
jgi:hypothetical protein